LPLQQECALSVLYRFDKRRHGFEVGSRFKDLIDQDQVQKKLVVWHVREKGFLKEKLHFVEVGAKQKLVLGGSGIKNHNKMT
jgi:hypothetical protein